MIFLLVVLGVVGRRLHPRRVSELGMGLSVSVGLFGEVRGMKSNDILHHHGNTIKQGKARAYKRYTNTLKHMIGESKWE